MQYLILLYLAALLLAVAVLPAAIGLLLVFLPSAKNASRPWFGAWIGGVLGYVGYSAFVLLLGGAMVTALRYNTVAWRDYGVLLGSLGLFIVLPSAASIGSVHGFIAGWRSAGKRLPPPAAGAVSAQFQEPPPLPRPGSITAIANLNLVFGAVGMAACFLVLVAANPSASDSVNGVQGHQAGLLLLATALVSLLLKGAAIVTGIGLLKLAPWGRTWTIAYAISAILCAPLGWFVETTVDPHLPNPGRAIYPVLSILLSCIYPTLLLFLAHTQSWKAALGHKTTHA